MNFDFLSSWSVGMVKACMRSAFEKSKDAHIQIIRKPEMRVIVLKAFKKNSFQLVGLATSVVLSSVKPSESTTTVGHMFDHKGKNYYGIVRGSVSWPRSEALRSDCNAKETEPFLVGYWAVRSTSHHDEVNMVKDAREIRYKIGDSKPGCVLVPTMTNCKDLEAGDELCILKQEKPKPKQTMKPTRATQGTKKGAATASTAEATASTAREASVAGAEGPSKRRRVSRKADP